MHAFQIPVLDVAYEKGGHQYRDCLRDLIAWSERQPRLVAREHEATGETEAQTVIKYVIDDGDGSTPVFWAAYPHQHKIDLYFLKEPPFEDERERKEARTILRGLVGANDETLPPDQIKTLRLDALTTEDAREGLHAFLGWALRRTLSVGR